MPPSPNINSWTAALVYPGMCLLEGTNLSEGRGTTTPFMVFGAPYIDDPVRLASSLDNLRLDGVAFLPTWFVPDSDKWAKKRCGGVRLVITDRQSFKPLLAGISVLSVCSSGFPDGFRFRKKAYEFVSDRLAIDLLLGDDSVRRSIVSGEDPRSIYSAMEPETRQFMKEREAFLLY
ncbi:MAG: DUF1343 domain-containing protein [Deltaproteobacteria bacterium]|nr:DUF1343 domain-containing protein [Deltaproteobacteria bacterium]